ncbi:MAG: penicillin-binding protein activator [Alphaproteobacteria bacterium GM7ARS4]|nr:penicillin-binding protein activator [Alphaproteobacteria bacterium GM7ARS4]
MRRDRGCETMMAWRGRGLSFLWGCAVCVGVLLSVGYGALAYGEEDDFSFTEFFGLGDDEATDEDIDGDIVEGVDLSGKRKIGLFVPLSGKNAALGRVLFDTAQMALFDFAGGDIDIAVYDSFDGDEDKVQRSFEQAQKDGVEVIAGPLFAHSVEALASLARAERIPLLAFSSDASKADKGVYIMGYRVEEEINTIVAYVRGRGFLRFALLAEDTPYGHLIDETLDVATDIYDANYTRKTLFSGDIKDIGPLVEVFSDYVGRENFIQKQLDAFGLDEENDAHQGLINEVRDMATLPFDAVLVPLHGQELVSAIAFLAFYDVTNTRVRFLGTSLWENRAFLNEPLLRGSLFVATDIEKRQKFTEQFTAAFKREPPKVASIVYDTVAMIVGLMQRHGRVEDEHLIIEEGFDGVNGLFRLRADGTVERAYHVYGMASSGFTLIHKGIETFQPEGPDDEDSSLLGGL